MEIGEQRTVWIYPNKVSPLRNQQFNKNKDKNWYILSYLRTNITLSFHYQEIHLCNTEIPWQIKDVRNIISSLQKITKRLHIENNV